MIHEWRTYRLKPGAAPAYLSLFAERGLPLVTKHLPLMGYWLAESGPLNVIHHLWTYADWADRDACRAALGGEEAWTSDFIPAAFALVEEQKNVLLHLVSGSQAFDDAFARRKHVQSSRPAGMPLFIPECAGLIVGAQADDAVAVWRPLSGAADMLISLLPRQADPLAVRVPDGAQHVVLRPLAFSPL